MGLFDLFRRQRRGTDAEAYFEANKPRVQYYLFAHGALRELAFEQPMIAFGGVLSDKLRDDTGRRLWDAVAEQLDGTGEPTEPFPGIESRMVQCGTYPCALVKMPQPRKQTEAHFVAIILRVDPKKDRPQPPVPVSYFTLEHGGPDDGTVLGEWTKEGQHVNHGEGPPPDWDAFHQAVQSCVGAGATA